VVLIDEVDKAPRDFPNDILNELEEMSFPVPELDNFQVEADHALRPILVITSNSEKNLPDAFLRRCIYYNIPFPNRARLAEIVEARLGWAADQPGSLLSDALTLFERLRLPASGLRKKPATSELLGWVAALHRVAPAVPNPLRSAPGVVRSTVCSLVKTAEDQELAHRIIQQWIESPA
jgi:MoxR-like ATPase